MLMPDFAIPLYNQYTTGVETKMSLLFVDSRVGAHKY